MLDVDHENCIRQPRFQQDTERRIAHGNRSKTGIDGRLATAGKFADNSEPSSISSSLITISCCITNAKPAGQFNLVTRYPELLSSPSGAAVFVLAIAKLVSCLSPQILLKISCASALSVVRHPRHKLLPAQPDSPLNPFHKRPALNIHGRPCPAACQPLRAASGDDPAKPSDPSAAAPQVVVF